MRSTYGTFGDSLGASGGCESSLVQEVGLECELPQDDDKLSLPCYPGGFCFYRDDQSSSDSEYDCSSGLVDAGRLMADDMGGEEESIVVEEGGVVEDIGSIGGKGVSGKSDDHKLSKVHSVLLTMSLILVILLLIAIVIAVILTFYWSSLP